MNAKLSRSCQSTLTRLPLAASSCAVSSKFTIGIFDMSDLHPLRRARTGERWGYAQFHRSPQTALPMGLLLAGAQGILDRFDGRELDVVQLAVHLLDLADILVLDDVPGLRVDRDPPARALPRHAFHSRNQSVAIA